MLLALKAIFVQIPSLLKSKFLEMLFLMSLIILFLHPLRLVIKILILVPVLGLALCYFFICVKLLQYWALLLTLIQAHFQAPHRPRPHLHQILSLLSWAPYLYQLPHLLSLGPYLNHFPQPNPISQPLHLTHLLSYLLPHLLLSQIPPPLYPSQQAPLHLILFYPIPPPLYIPSPSHLLILCKPSPNPKSLKRNPLPLQPPLTTSKPNHPTILLLPKSLNGVQPWLLSSMLFIGNIHGPSFLHVLIKTSFGVAGFTR